MTGIQNCKVNGKRYSVQGYDVLTIGNIREDAIKKYVQEQLEKSREEESKKYLFIEDQ